MHELKLYPNQEFPANKERGGKGLKFNILLCKINHVSGKISGYYYSIPQQSWASPPCLENRGIEFYIQRPQLRVRVPPKINNLRKCPQWSSPTPFLPIEEKIFIADLASMSHDQNFELNLLFFSVENCINT